MLKDENNFWFSHFFSRPFFTRRSSSLVVVIIKIHKSVKKTEVIIVVMNSVNKWMRRWMRTKNEMGIGVGMNGWILLLGRKYAHESREWIYAKITFTLWHIPRREKKHWKTGSVVTWCIVYGVMMRVRNTRSQQELSLFFSS